MSRDALIVGISIYDHQQLENFQNPPTPALDAEAIAKRLVHDGNFRVWRLPEDVIENNNKKEWIVSEKGYVKKTALKKALKRLFLPKGRQIPEAALFYFSGHGMSEYEGFHKGFLATSDTDPSDPESGISFIWLQWLLQESPIQQQIVWLDCCHSGAFIRGDMTAVNPGHSNSKDRCFIASSRDFEESWLDKDRHYSLFTKALLEGLDPTRISGNSIDNYELITYINQTLKGDSQAPIFIQFGGAINIIEKSQSKEISIDIDRKNNDICPYKGLNFFDSNNEDPKYFFGRDDLISEIIDHICKSTFTVLVGASGSGKSSVLRAGVLHQLKIGQRVSGSEQWNSRIIQPGSKPLKNLSQSFINPDFSEAKQVEELLRIKRILSQGTEELQYFFDNFKTPRMIIAIDQFEEIFTVCEDNDERKKFLNCLLSLLNITGNKVCLILAIRADFFGKCLDNEYRNLATYFKQNVVAVNPMNRKELKDAITEPAKKVSLFVELELTEQIILDVEDAPASLPLMQYSLTQLWSKRLDNQLQLKTYVNLGGIKGTLGRRATAVYESMSEEQQQAAEHIFLSLTQLGEGTEDIQRCVIKNDLITRKFSKYLIEKTIEKLTDAKLIVTTQEIIDTPKFNAVSVIRIAHEVLIRHWPLMRKWLDQNRSHLHSKRSIERAADEWRANGNYKAYLLRGKRLVKAREFQKIESQFLLSDNAERLIQESLRERRTRGCMVISFIVAVLAVAGLFIWQQRSYFYELTLNVFLESNKTNSEITKILSDLLNKADKHMEAGNSDQALLYYQAVISNIGKLQDESVNDLLKIRSSENQVIKKCWNKSEKAITKIIRSNQIPILEKYLTDNKIGKLSDESNLLDYEKQFSEGALQITYSILMREMGVKADTNNDGIVNNVREAERIPCDILNDINNLWHTSTEKRCSFYVNNSFYKASRCTELNGRTLTEKILPGGTASVLADRLKTCNISPQSADIYQ